MMTRLMCWVLRFWWLSFSHSTLSSGSEIFCEGCFCFCFWFWFCTSLTTTKPCGWTSRFAVTSGFPCVQVFVGCRRLCAVHWYPNGLGRYNDDKVQKKVLDGQINKSFGMSAGCNPATIADVLWWWTATASPNSTHLKDLLLPSENLFCHGNFIYRGILRNKVRMFSEDASTKDFDVIPQNKWGRLSEKMKKYKYK